MAGRDRGPLIAVMASITALLAIGAGFFLTKEVAPEPGTSPSPTASAPYCTVEGKDTFGQKSFPSEPCLGIDRRTKVYIATMETSMGTIRVVLDPKLAPRTVNSFVFLARQGFYDNTIFHRVQNVVSSNPQKDFALVQGGDPTGTGRGGPGYAYGEPPPPITRYLRGNIVMARKEEANSNGSQFFFVVRDWEELDPNYTFFGVTIDDESLAVLDEMVKASGSSLGSIGIRPDPPIRLIRVTIEERDRNPKD